MSGGFVKLYGSILDSSVWGEPQATRLVWITMLAMADKDGHVESSVPGLARRANVSIAECQSALTALEGPDPFSKSPEHDGRRIEPEEGGWAVLNHQKYRDLRTESQIAEAERKAAWRAKKIGTCHGTAPEIHTDTYTDTDNYNNTSSGRELLLALLPTEAQRIAWNAVIETAIQSRALTEVQAVDACRDYVGNGNMAKLSIWHFRAYLKRAGKPPMPMRPGKAQSQHDILRRFANGE